MRDTFRLKVMSINGVYYDGQARNIILPCIDGQYSIMARHEEVTVAIYNGQLKIQKPDGEWITAINGIGYAQAANNRCTVIADTVENPEDIDRRRAQEALEEAQEQIRQKNSMQEYKEAQATVARALNRLKLSGTKSTLNL